MVEKKKTERLFAESIVAACEGKTSLSKHWQSICQQLRLATPFFSVRTLVPCATLCKDGARIKALSRPTLLCSFYFGNYAIICCIKWMPPSFGNAVVAANQQSICNLSNRDIVTPRSEWVIQNNVMQNEKPKWKVKHQNPPRKKTTKKDKGGKKKGGSVKHTIADIIETSNLPPKQQALLPTKRLTTKVARSKEGQ